MPLESGLGILHAKTSQSIDLCASLLVCLEFQIRSVAPLGRGYLPARYTSRVTGLHLVSVQVSALSVEQIAQLTVEQIQAMPPELMAALTEDQLAAISPKTLAKLPAGHIQALPALTTMLTPIQLAALPADLLAQLPQKTQAAVKAMTLVKLSNPEDVAQWDSAVLANLTITQVCARTSAICIRKSTSSVLLCCCQDSANNSGSMVRWDTYAQCGSVLWH